MRSRGPCKIEHAAEVAGVAYDPDLISQSDLEFFIPRAMSVFQRSDPVDHLTRVLRHAERIRSHKTWPQDLAEHIEQIDTRPIEDQLEVMTPGAPDFLRRLAHFRLSKPEKYSRSRWKVWYEEWKQERAEARRLRAEERRGSQEEQHTRELKRRREAHRAKQGVSRPPGRPRLVTLDEHRRWYAIADPFGVNFLKKRNALEWARHLAGVKRGLHERSAEYMLELLSRDRALGPGDRAITRRVEREETIGFTKRGHGGR